MNSSRTQTLALCGGVLAIAACAFFKTNHYPLYDSALFEYAGRAILRDQRLYAYVWDNKLPPIYYLNALYQQLFGERYALHLLAQITINLASISFFAQIARTFDLSRWRQATIVLAALLLLPPPQFNQVEYPALFLILAAYLAWLKDRAIFAGLLLALATTFWVPSLLLILPIGFSERLSEQRVSTAISTIIALAALITVFIAGFGLATMQEVFASWLSYGTQAITISDAWSNFYRGALLSGSGLLIAIALIVTRTPQSSQERFALLWVIAALAGTAATLRFYPHYFAVALAPLTLYISEVGLPPRSRRVAIAVVGLFLMWKSTLAIAADTKHHWDRAERVASIAKSIPLRLQPPRYITVDEYEPGIYLAADVALRSQYEIAYLPNKPFLRGRNLNQSLIRLNISIDPLPPDSIIDRYC